MKWAVYYSDGSRISDEDTTPYNIEKRVDVQVIVQISHDHNWVTLSGHDFYCWDDRGGRPRWYKATKSGLDQYLMRPGFKCVLFGYEIDKQKFNEIFDKARKDFGEKLGFESNERQP